MTTVSGGMERSVLITGCSSGIGRATADAFLAEEWNVVATARNLTDIADLGECGCQIEALDVTDDEAIERVVEAALDEQGRLDCLVNNAGYAQIGPIEDVPPAHWRRQFAVNLDGPQQLIRRVLPEMRRRGDGTVVNVSSVLGRISLPGSGAYAASKFALEGMSDALRAEVNPFGVNVVVIEVGPVETDFKQRAGREVDGLARTDAYAGLYGMIEDWRALGGGPWSVTPDAVADSIVNAASATQPEPRYVVGGFGKLSVIGRLLPAGITNSLYRSALKITSSRYDE